MRTSWMKSDSSMDRHGQEHITQQGTQTSKTVLELAMLELNQVQSDTYMAKISDGTAVQQLELGPNETSSPKAQHCMLPRLSRFTIREIRVKSVDKNICVQKNDEADTTISEDPRSLSVTSDQPVLSTSHTTITDTPAPELVVSPACDVTEHARPLPDTLHTLMSHVQSEDWIISMDALVALSESLASVDRSTLLGHMPAVNQRLLEFLASPRSHVCRTGCQVAGRLFAEVKDTRRPEFDTIVELLLAKTADANRFIRQDASVSLQIMVRSIAPFHTVRAISQRSPCHKNDLVRISCARLFLCITEHFGAGLVLNATASDSIRKRILTHMTKFIKDKNYKTREYGARLYMELQSHPNFEYYLKQIIDKSNIMEIRNILKDKLYIK